ncbi:MAG: 3-phosphoshikimate 1-carboxyvinyltransferase [Candidatus Omnitrophica bacterium]|nr:3-phosphoshikimate 1-carboxyvinyltransferase [Candidatus Omnitrophota bacterium]
MIVMDWTIKPVKTLRGTITVPPDKSVSHRAIMFGAIAEGDTRVTNFLMGEDCLCTLNAFKSLGVEIAHSKGTVEIRGAGLSGLKAPKRPIYLGNSGTSMRVISGILAGQKFTTILEGDDSLSNRPMERIMKPLKEMGASIRSLSDGRCAPLEISPSKTGLSGISYNSPVASAQVKSCILAAGLYARGETSVTEPFISRDHTERMFEYLSVKVARSGCTAKVKGGSKLIARDIAVPGDISSAAFFIAAGLIVKGSELTLKNTGLNPTRRGVLDVLLRMGANISVMDQKEGVEPVGDLLVKHSLLRSTIVKEEEIPLLIDEIPILIIAALHAEGETVIKGISELKVKETDRVESMRFNLAKMGVSFREENGNLYIKGKVNGLKNAIFDSFCDHRTAMSMAIAALSAGGNSTVQNVNCVNTSYPSFYTDLMSVSQ